MAQPIWTAWRQHNNIHSSAQRYSEQETLEKDHTTAAISAEEEETLKEEPPSEDEIQAAAYDFRMSSMLTDKEYIQLFSDARLLTLQLLFLCNSLALQWIESHVQNSTLPIC